MLERSISQLIELFPRGTTDGQLLWRLRSNGLRNDASSVLAALTALSDRGEVRRIGDRWFGAGKTGSQPAGPPSTLGSAVGSLGEPLRAVRVSVDSLIAEPSDVDTSTSQTLPGWQPLLRYYAATQRQDPRGSVERFRDQHGGGWQLFDCSGPWWHEARLSTRADQLPPTFRQALAMIGTSGVASAGWPVTVVQGPEGTAFCRRCFSR